MARNSHLTIGMQVLSMTHSVGLILGYYPSSIPTILVLIRVSNMGDHRAQDWAPPFYREEKGGKGKIIKGRKDEGSPRQFQGWSF
jgi:hypothetical protein